MAPPAFPPYYRRNFALLLADFVLFSSAMAFVSASTVLPEFLRQLTTSSALIGLLSTIQMGAWTLPQLLAANYVTGRPRKLPCLIVPAAVGRPALLLLAALTWGQATQRPWLVLAAAYICLALFMFTDALAAVPWFDLVAKMVPATRRGRLFGGGQVLGGLAAVGVAAAVRSVLAEDGLPFPANYAFLFLMSGLLMLVSLATYPLLREPAGRQAGERTGGRAFLSRLGTVLRRDRAFRRFTAVRLTAGAGGLAGPFYVLFATGELGLDSHTLGLFITAQTAGGITAGLGLNYLNETRGSRSVIRTAALLAAFAPLTAFVFAGLDQRGVPVGGLAYSAVFLLTGIANGAVMPGFFAYLLEFATEAERPTYLALSNSLNSAVIAAPLLGGWLLDRTSYGLLFALTAAGLLVSFALSLGLCEPRAPRGAPDHR